MSELPDGWCARPIGEIGIWRGGGTPTKANTAFWQDGNIPWISPKDMKRFFIDSAEDQITLAAVNESATQLIPADSVLLVTRSGILRHSLPVAVSTCEVAINQDLKALSPFASIDPVFVGLQIQSRAQEILGTCSKSGTTVDSVDFERLKTILIRLPPLAEQRRIVAKVDSLSAKSKRARDQLDHIPRLVEKYKRAILGSAYDGKLLTGIASADRAIPISAMIASLDQGWSPKCESEAATDPQHWAVIKTTAIQRVEFNDSENKRLPGHLTPRANIAVEPEDILVTRAGPRSRVAIACIVKQTRPNLMLCDKAYRLRVKPRIADPTFLTYMLNAPQSLDTLEQMKTGMSDSGLNLTQAKFLDLPIPEFPLSVQQEIARRIQTALAWIDRLAFEATSARKLIDHLNQAILAKAFRGELVPQDPNDEPASVLLERIKAQRHGSSKTKRHNELRDPAALAMG
jgi:type I restriction enzyme S subunit